MTHEIADAAAFFEIDVNWVHVSEVEMKGRHFSVKALQEEMEKVAA